MAYTDNTELSDEWIIQSYLHEVNLNVFFDQAYDALYTNPEGRIATELKQLRLFYLRELNIYVDYSIPEIFTSTADECESLGTNCPCRATETPCYHLDHFEDDIDITSSDMEYVFTHCKNRHYMAYWQTYSLLEDDPLYLDKWVTVIFTGHDDLCEKGDDDSHSILSGNYEGGCYTNLNTMLIFGKSQIDQTDETISLMHEFGHIYELYGHSLDHYGIECPSTSEANSTNDGYPSYSVNCLYGENAFDEGFVPQFCPHCKDYIERTLHRYKHELWEVQ